MAIIKGKVVGYNSLQADGRIIKCYVNRIQDRTFQPLDLASYIEKAVEVEGNLHGDILSQAQFKRLIKAKSECKNCIYFNELTTISHEFKTGRCQLNPPVYYYDPIKQRMDCDFPLVGDFEWCGKFEPKKSD